MQIWLCFLCVSTFCEHVSRGNFVSPCCIMQPVMERKNSLSSLQLIKNNKNTSIIYYIRHSAFLQQLVTVMNLVGKLLHVNPTRRLLPRGCAHTSTLHPSTFVRQHLFWCEPSVSTFGGTQRCPSSARSSLFWCCQLVIYCFNEVHAQTHKHHFQAGLRE